MRIIAGKHRGRRIELLRDAAHVRPTSGFAREAIFNILSHGAYGTPETSPYMGKRVLDLFCGTGAFGLEALSRGAGHVTFVDLSRESLQVARMNAERMGEISTTAFLRADAAQLPTAREPYSLVFLDAPYDKPDLVGQALKSLLAGGWMAKDAVVVVEHEARQKPPIPDALTQIDERHYGRAVIRFMSRGS